MYEIEPRPAAVRTTEDISRLVRSLFGVRSAAPGVLHPTAVWRSPEGRLVTMKIEAGTPGSATDAFVLSWARARADAIVTTGRNLRKEPELVHGLIGPGRVPEVLAAWRKEELGKEGPPVSLVLTSGRGLDLDHPLLVGGETHPVIFTGEEGCRRLEAGALRRGIEVAGHPSPGIRQALAFLRQRGARTISIEAGPSTSRRLYDEPLAVDELLLSVYEEAQLSPAVRGGDFLPVGEIEALFPAASSGDGWTARGRKGREVKEPSGQWSFHRFLRPRG